MYVHALKCALADENGGLLRGKLYLYNRTVLEKTQHLSVHPLLYPIVVKDCCIFGNTPIFRNDIIISFYNFFMQTEGVQI